MIREFWHEFDDLGWFARWFGRLVFAYCFGVMAAFAGGLAGHVVLELL